MGQLHLPLEHHGGNPPVTCGQPSIPAVAPNPGIQPITDHVVLRYLLLKNTCLSGPAQFKPTFLKSQLYCQVIKGFFFI